MTDTTDTRERLREKLRAKRRERTGDSAPSRVDNVRRAEELVLNSTTTMWTHSYDDECAPKTPQRHCLS